MKIFGTVESHIDSKNRIIISKLFREYPMENANFYGERINNNLLRYYLTEKLCDVMSYLEKNGQTEKDMELYKRIIKILANESGESLVNKPDVQGRMSLIKGFRDDCVYENYKVITVGEGGGFVVISSPEVFTNYRNGDYGFSLETEKYKIR